MFDLIIQISCPLFHHLSRRSRSIGNKGACLRVPRTLSSVFDHSISDACMGFRLFFGSNSAYCLELLLMSACSY